MNYEGGVRTFGPRIGLGSFVNDLRSTVSKGLDDKTCMMLARINEQSPDITGSAHVGKEGLDLGAGDQGFMFGSASDATEDYIPLTHSVVTRIGTVLVYVVCGITTQAKADYEGGGRAVFQRIVLDTFVDDLHSTVRKGLYYTTCMVLARIYEQSPGIAGGVHVGPAALT
eukprot:NODE_11491_length_1283_cov_8.103806.p2 GENE.NODE_11491_length_1283_cov_8.103806~~NODE_11491_length_1283_cov_8.103806.p2  ORF type:complete len:170 (+),score=31.67 NODE_11491_length_1283_cov_8.103806:41-550(+)